MECEPGAEVQVDFGTGAPVMIPEGEPLPIGVKPRRRRTHVFRMVLSHSRKAYSEVVYPRPPATEGFRESPALHRRAVTGAPHRPKMPSPGVSLPGLFATVPSPVLPLAPPWLHTPASPAGFEQRVLNECGLAQVGFGIDLTSFRASPFLHGARSVVDLIPSRYGSRALTGLQQARVLTLPWAHAHGY